MDGGPYPAIFLLRRFILGPACIVFLAFCGWALVVEHWWSAALLLAAGVLGAAIRYELTQVGEGREPSVMGNPPPAPRDAEPEPDDSQELARGLTWTNILFSCLLIGLVWAEGLPLLRSAMFVVLFSILFPAGAVAFCVMGEQMLRQHRSRAQWTHRGSPRHPGAKPAH